jgi:hypothetical protein
MRARLVDGSLDVDPAFVLVLMLVVMVVAHAKGALRPFDQVPVVVRHRCGLVLLIDLLQELGRTHAAQM